MHQPFDETDADSILSALSAVVTEDADWCSLSREPEPSSRAGLEEQADDRGLETTSMSDTSLKMVRLYLWQYVQAAGQHLRSAVWLLQSYDAEAALSIRTLSRAACESSSLAFWLCDLDIGLDGRLRRCNQLFVRSMDSALRNERTNSSIAELTTKHAARLRQYEQLRDDALDWARDRGWLSPSGKNYEDLRDWIKQIPTFTKLMGQITEAIGYRSELGRSVYMSLSGTVHTDLLSAGMDIWEGPSTSRSHRTILAVGVTVGAYALAIDRISRWTGWETNIETWVQDVIGALEHLDEDAALPNDEDVQR